MPPQIVERYPRAPSALRFMARAIRPAQRLPDDGGFPAIALQWSGFYVDPAQMRVFREATGLMDGTHAAVLLPHVFGFRLQMALLTHRRQGDGGRPGKPPDPRHRLLLGRPGNLFSSRPVRRGVACRGGCLVARSGIGQCCGRIIQLRGKTGRSRWSIPAATGIAGHIAGNAAPVLDFVTA